MSVPTSFVYLVLYKRRLSNIAAILLGGNELYFEKIIRLLVFALNCVFFLPRWIWFPQFLFPLKLTHFPFIKRILWLRRFVFLRQCRRLHVLCSL